MISRHDIRQAAVQFLYGIGLNHSTTDIAETFAPFWGVILESAYSGLLKNKAKAIEHLTRDRYDKLRIFQTRSDNFLSEYGNDSSLSALKESLEDIVKRENSHTNAIQEVKLARKNLSDSNNVVLENSLESLMLLNATLLQLRERFFTMLADYVTHFGVLTPLAASLKRLQEIGKRIDSLTHPENCDNKAEFIHVVEAASDIEELKSETEKLVRGILPMLEELDNCITEVTDNFAPERISPVDRAILRIAAYELKNKKDLPTAVIIKEAIRLAESYSVREATKFVNGVLAGIARKYRPEQVNQV